MLNPVIRVNHWTQYNIEKSNNTMTEGQKLKGRLLLQDLALWVHVLTYEELQRRLHLKRRMQKQRSFK